MRVSVVVGAIAVFGASASTAIAGVPSGVVPDVPSGTPGPQITHGLAGTNLDWQGGPVMHSNRTYVIYWNPSNCTFNSSPCAYDPGYQTLTNGFLANVAADSHKASNVYAIDGQYGDSTARAFYDSTFVQAVQDTDALASNGCTLPPPPPTSTGPGWTMCVSDSQLRTEINHVLSVDHLPTGIGNLYFVVMPNGFGSCFGNGLDPMVVGGYKDCSVSGGGTVGVPVSGSFCGYHSAMGTVSNPVLFSDMPYNAVPTHCRSDNPRPNNSAADPTISTLSHEHNETITDPLAQGFSPLSGWIQNSDGQEIGDLCAGSFGTALGSTAFGLYNEVVGTGRYVLQGEFSNEDSGGSCQQRDEADSASFTSAASTLAGTPVSFTGSGVDPDGTIASFTWNFGDGSAPAVGAHVNHAFSHAGTFTVTMTAQDVSGQRVFVLRTIHVAASSITKISSKAGKHTGTISVTVNGPGTVKVGGTRKTLSRAGTVTFTVRLSAKARKRLARKSVHKITVTIKVTFSPVGRAAQTRTVSLTFRG